MYNVRVCQGCKKHFEPNELKPPHDLVFKLKAVRPYKDPKTLIWHDRMGNAYFHLSVECLRKHNAVVDISQLTMQNDTFLGLNQQHMHYLQQKGLLSYLISNKEKETS